MYHSLLIFLATYFLLSHGKHPLTLSLPLPPSPSSPPLVDPSSLPTPPLPCFLFLILTKKVQPSLFLLFTETPFENGKVFGLWYVGNTVYTVTTTA